jgi:hypothetical protein
MGVPAQLRSTLEKQSGRGERGSFATHVFFSFFFSLPFPDYAPYFTSPKPSEMNSVMPALGTGASFKDS